jgi:hypothetical protein
LILGAKDAYAIAPPNPPFPTPSNFPFHPEAGIHTSIPISESLVGVSIAATRQNAGIFSNTSPLGAVKVPAGIHCAAVIVASGSLSEARFSHGSPAAWPAPAVAKVKMTTVTIFRKDITVFPYPSIPTYLAS